MVGSVDENALHRNLERKTIYEHSSAKADFVRRKNRNPEYINLLMFSLFNIHTTSRVSHNIRSTNQNGPVTHGVFLLMCSSRGKFRPFHSLFTHDP